MVQHQLRFYASDWIFWKLEEYWFSPYDSMEFEKQKKEIPHLMLFWFRWPSIRVRFLKFFTLKKRRFNLLQASASWKVGPGGLVRDSIGRPFIGTQKNALILKLNKNILFLVLNLSFIVFHFPLSSRSWIKVTSGTWKTWRRELSFRKFLRAPSNHFHTGLD